MSSLGLALGLSFNNSPAGGGSPPLETVAVDQLLDLSGAVTDAIVDLAALAAGSKGADVGTWEYDGVSDPLLHTRVSNASITPRRAILCDGVTYLGPALRGWYFDLTEGAAGSDPVEGFRNVPSAGKTNFAVTAWCKFNTTGDNWAIDWIGVWSGSKYAVAQQRILSGESGTQGYINAHGQVGGSTTRGIRIPIVADTWYEITVLHNATAAKAQVVILDATTGAFIGASECSSDINISDVVLGIFHDYPVHTGAAGSATFVAPVFDWTNHALPLLPFTLPAPTDVSAEQTDPDEITLSFKSGGLSFKIERYHSGSWTTLETAWTGARLQTDTTATAWPYVDGTVTDGETYKYRVTANVGSHASAASSETADVTVDNAAFPNAVETFNGFTNNQALNVAGTWTYRHGTWVVQVSAGNGSVYMSTAGGTTSAAYWTAHAGSQDHRVEWTHNVAAAYPKIGGAVRIQAAEKAWYDVVVDNARVRLRKVADSAGTPTPTTIQEILHSVSGIDPVTTTFALSVTGSGAATRLTVQVDEGAGWTDLMASVDPGTYLGSGYYGIGAVGNDPGTKIDVWRAYEL